MREDEERERSPNQANAADMDLDETNLEEQFHDQDLGTMLQDAADSQMTTESTAFLGGHASRSPQRYRNQPTRTRATSKWTRQQRNIDAVLDEEEDVPESLLLEGQQPIPSSATTPNREATLPPPIPGPSNPRHDTPWAPTAARRRSSQGDSLPNARPVSGRTAMFIADPKEKAMWRWANVLNLDNFLFDVYRYYTNHGFWSIMLARLLNML
jgi:autophagy-related protein 9